MVGGGGKGIGTHGVVRGEPEAGGFGGAQGEAEAAGALARDEVVVRVRDEDGHRQRRSCAWVKGLGGGPAAVGQGQRYLSCWANKRQWGLLCSPA